MGKAKEQESKARGPVSRKATVEILSNVHFLGLGDLHLENPITETKDLPFVLWKERDYWHVEPSDNFSGDCSNGTDYACAYLNYALNDIAGIPLTWIIEKMDKLRTGEGHGIEVGFLCTIQEYAKLGASFAKVSKINLAKGEKFSRAYLDEAMKNPRAEVSEVINRVNAKIDLS